MIGGTHSNNCSVDASLVLSVLNQHFRNHSAADASTFFAAHGMDTEDLLLDESDIISHLMNGCCANHATDACTEISRRVKSPVKMAIAVTQIVIDEYLRRQLSSEHLRTICFAVGIKPDCNRRESDNLIKKLRLRCKDLQPLLNQTGLESIFSTVEGLRKRPLQQLAIQHQLSLCKDEVSDVDGIKTRLVDHISSGSC